MVVNSSSDLDGDENNINNNNYNNKESINQQQQQQQNDENINNNNNEPLNILQEKKEEEKEEGVQEKSENNDICNINNNTNNNNSEQQQQQLNNNNVSDNNNETTTKNINSSSSSSSTTIKTNSPIILLPPQFSRGKENLDSLVKLYNSKEFDSWMAVCHLFLYRDSNGVIDYLCNKLYSLEDKDIDFFITQICILLINQPHDQKSSFSSLARFVLDRCAKSMRFAIKACWIFQAFEEDGAKNLLSIDNQVHFLQPPSSSISPSTSPKEQYNQTNQIIPIDLDKLYNVSNNNHIQGVSQIVRRNKVIYRTIEHKKELATRLREFCEMSVISCSRPNITRPRTSSLPSPVLNFSSSSSSSSTSSTKTTSSTTVSFSNLSLNNNNSNNNDEIKSSIDYEQVTNSPIEKSKTPPDIDIDYEFMMTKNFRCDYFDDVIHFVQRLSNISKYLAQFPVDRRQAKLKNEISLLNINLPLGLYIPFLQSSKHHCIVRIPPEEVKILNSRERIPFLLVLEIIESENEATSADILETVSSYLQYTTLAKNNLVKTDYMNKYINLIPLSSDGSPIKKSTTISTTPPTEEQQQQQKQPDLIISKNEENTSSTTTTTTTTTTSATTTTSTNIKSISTSTTLLTTSNGTPTSTTPPTSSPLVDKLFSEKTSPFGELWEEKTERYRRISPYGHLKNWKLCSVIVKTGDDCRQEQMAVQLINKFDEIWKEANLPLYLRPYQILVTSSSGGIIETIPDTISLHNLKKNTPNFTTLLNYFKSTYGENTEAFKIAQNNFIESMAAYSIVTYLLQVKDRHNGNILIDKEGHIVHIDFGFILSNSPGNISFESAPFKLTQEFVDVMGGINSGKYLYFTALCVRGFREARKHMEKIVQLIEIMMTGPKMSCFVSGVECINQLRDRFLPNSTDIQCGREFEKLIFDSVDHFKTRYYDKYQSWYNGIIP
eukprot:gene4860-6057_t